MMNYKYLIDDMVWSYSRVNTYNDCPYKFLLKYIFQNTGVSKFFANYGKYMHEILQKYYEGELNENSLVSYYLENYAKCILCRAPTQTLHMVYYKGGIDYFLHIKPLFYDVLSVEHKMEFKIGKYPFIGYLDLIGFADNKLTICDHKSQKLKPRSNRKTQTKGDVMLDEYFRQLYIYAYGWQQETGELPDQLMFNCFRSNQIITEQFDKEKFDNAKQWILDTIKKIEEENDWEPNYEFFKCKYICDVSNHCEYFKINNGGD